MKIVSTLHRGSALTPLDPSGEWQIKQPADHSKGIAKAIYAYSQIDQVVADLKEEAKGWSVVSTEERKKTLIEALCSLTDLKKDWFETEMLESGRTKVDLDFEWNQFESWVRFFSKESVEDLLVNRDSRGLVALIGTYQWPLLYTIQPLFYSLLAGNAVVIKPSERATLATLLLGECLCRHPKIKSILSVLVGDRELGRRLACHEKIDTVLFYGTFEVGIRVRQDTLGQPSKEVLLFLGGKNPSIVFDDASDDCVSQLIQDCFLSSGQNCRSVSQIWIHENLFDSFVKRFHEASKLFKIGPPESGAYAGPLIESSFVDRYLKFIGISEREGAEIMMRGKLLESDRKGNAVTPTLAAFQGLTPEKVRKSVSLQTEILAPHVSLVSFKSEADLLALMKEMNHGLIASVWTQDRARSDRLAKALPFGRVVINQGTLAMEPSVSFQAMKKSGNHAYHGPKLVEQLSRLRANQ